MTLPADFDRDLWFDPMTFEGLIGVALSRHKYAELFRADGYAKPKAESIQLPWVRDAVEQEQREALQPSYQVVA